MTFLIEHMPWWLGGLAVSFVMAGMVLVNQHFKAPAKDLILWRGFGLSLFLIGPALYYGLPTDPTFYGIALVGGILASILDRMIFHAAATYGGGVTSRILPASIWVGFSLWLVISTEYRIELWHDPKASLLILLCLAGSWYGISYMRKDTVNHEAILYMLPGIFILGIIDVLFKMALTNQGIQGLFTLPLIMSLSVGCFQLIVGLVQGKRHRASDLFAPQTVKAGLSLCAVMMLFPLTKNIAMLTTPNPAYITAMGLMAPVWVLLWNKICGVVDQVRLIPMLIFLGSIVGLVIVAA